MTPQEQNIAIAEACGWTIADQGEDGAYLMRRPDGEGCEYWKDDMHQACNILKMPSYTTDLNAMHEAEKTLIGPQAIFYERTIDSLVRGQATTQPGDRYPKAASVCAWHATAAQRAEAFLKTIGKWKE